jgi:ATP-dependent helicase YprA (DUF1998 family)
MNALAIDQARRFAELLDKTSAFNKLHFGMYGSKKKSEPRQGKRMKAEDVVTDHDTMRKTARHFAHLFQNIVLPDAAPPRTTSFRKRTALKLYVV